MKNLQLIFILMSLILIPASFISDEEQNVNENRKIDSFESVSVKNNILLEISISSNNVLEIYKTSYPLESIITKVNKYKILEIYTKNSYDSIITIHLKTNQIKALSCYNKAKVIFMDSIKENAFAIAQSDDSEVILNIKTTHLACTLSNNSKLNISGTTKDIALTVRGRAKFLGAKFKVLKNCATDKSNSGIIQLSN